MIGLDKKIFREPLWQKPNGSGFDFKFKNQLQFVFLTHVLNPTHENQFQQYNFF